MYGRIARTIAVPGKREALAEILVNGTHALPGCLSYVVAADSHDPDALWITEIWEDAESHQAALSLPAIQTTVAQGRPLIASFSTMAETLLVGGSGLPKSAER